MRTSSMAKSKAKLRQGLALSALILLLAGCEQKSAPLPQVQVEVPAVASLSQAKSPAAAQPPQAPMHSNAASAGDISAGRAKYSTFCAGCHGPKAEGIANYPKLAGQAATVLETKLATFRAGQKIGPNSGSMIPIARMLSETEVKQVAAFLGSL